MNKLGIQTLTNYIERKTGHLYHGSELTYCERFQSGNYQRIKSYQCNQNMPYASGKDENGNWIIVRQLYGKEVFECTVLSKENYEKSNNKETKIFVKR